MVTQPSEPLEAPPIEALYNSPTLKSKLQADPTMTRLLRQVALEDPETAPHLVSQNETVGTISAADIATVFGEMETSFRQCTGKDMSSLPWFAQAMPVDILTGETNDTMTRLSVLGCLTQEGQVTLRVYAHNQYDRTLTGDMGDGRIAAAENGVVIAHRRFAPSVSMDTRNIVQQTHSSDEPIRIVVENMYLGQNKVT